MNKINEAYNQWASTYDAMENSTRDLDKAALRSMLSTINFKNILAIAWLNFAKNFELNYEDSDGVFGKYLSQPLSGRDTKT